MGDGVPGRRTGDGRTIDQHRRDGRRSRADRGVLRPAPRYVARDRGALRPAPRYLARGAVVRSGSAALAMPAEKTADLVATDPATPAMATATRTVRRRRATGRRPTTSDAIVSQRPQRQPGCAA
jgi:hypothetical protein